MDLKVLRYFIACVENRTMHAAAEAVHVSQPALSKAIGNLEAHLGVVLLDRYPRGVTPTRFGDTLYHYSKRVDGEMRRAVAEINAMRGMTGGSIVVGVIPTMCAAMADVAMVVMDTLPGLKLKLKVAFASELMPALLDGELDLALLLLPESNALSGLTFDPLFQTRPMAAVRRDHPLAERSGVTLADLADYPWLIPDFPVSHHVIIDQAFIDVGLPPPKRAFEASTVVFFDTVVEQTDLITVVPSTLFSALFSTRAANLAMLQTDFVFPVEQIGLAYRQPGNLVPGARTIMDLIRNRCAPLPRPGPPAPIEQQL